MWTKFGLHTCETWERVRIGQDNHSYYRLCYIKRTVGSGIFQSFGLLGAIFTLETEYRISVAIARFKKEKALFACKLDLKFKV